MWSFQFTTLCVCVPAEMPTFHFSFYGVCVCTLYACFHERNESREWEKNCEHVFAMKIVTCSAYSG